MLTHLGTHVWRRLRRWYRRNAHMLGLVEERRAARRRPSGRRRVRLLPLAYRSG
jgi:hypothetical protein